MTERVKTSQQHLEATIRGLSAAIPDVPILEMLDKESGHSGNPRCVRDLFRDAAAALRKSEADLAELIAALPKCRHLEQPNGPAGVGLRCRRTATRGPDEQLGWEWCDDHLPEGCEAAEMSWASVIRRLESTEKP